MPVHKIMKSANKRDEGKRSLNWLREKKRKIAAQINGFAFAAFKSDFKLV